MVGCIACSDVVKLTRLGRLNMGAESGGALGLLKRLRGSKKADDKPVSAADQMKSLKRIPKILKYIPGTAQDLRAYFLTMQYWLAGSDENTVNMVRFLISRYADGPRRQLRGTHAVPAPIDYPEVGVYHPRMVGRIADTASSLPDLPRAPKGTVGILLMRSYILAGNGAHYDGVIAALEARAAY